MCVVVPKAKDNCISRSTIIFSLKNYNNTLYILHENNNSRVVSSDYKKWMLYCVNF